MNILYGILYLVAAPLMGGLVVGADRIITARMQGRVGPPLLQPFYDVLKLMEKEKVVVTRAQNLFIFAYIVFMALTGALFFAGGDFLLVIFAMTLAHIFIVLGAYSANSPYSFIGAERELIQIMAFEPMIILVATGMYLVAKSFYISDLVRTDAPLIAYLPGLFLGFVYVLNIKLRKSPFDLSSSHHAHQEIVKGITTEFSGSSLGRIEIAHWYETILLMGFIYLFFGFNPVIAIFAVMLVYLIELLVDNSFPRYKWELAFQNSWAAAFFLGMGNIIMLWYYLRGGM
ncbi:MAG: complex I subunit 1 family protein [Candidatus Altiarchaeota archaeon]